MALSRSGQVKVNKVCGHGNSDYHYTMQSIAMIIFYTAKKGSVGHTQPSDGDIIKSL